MRSRPDDDNLVNDVVLRDGPTSPARATVLHLVWILPLLAVIDIVSFVVANIQICGISGCSGGGFGVSSDPGASAVAIGFATLATAFLLIVVPWVRNRAVRTFFGVAAALATAIAMALPIFTAYANKAPDIADLISHSAGRP